MGDGDQSGAAACLGRGARALAPGAAARPVAEALLELYPELFPSRKSAKVAVRRGRVCVAGARAQPTGCASD